MIRFVGSTIAETLTALGLKDTVLGGSRHRDDANKAESRKTSASEIARIKAWGRIVVSAILLVIGAALVFSKGDAGSQKMGCSLLGVVAGYWLK